MGNINVNILFPGTEQSKDLDRTDSCNLNLNLSFHPGKISIGKVQDINALKKCLLTQSTSFSPFKRNYKPTELMTLDPLAPTFCPRQRPKLYSLCWPTTNRDMELLEATETPTISIKTPLPLGTCSSQFGEQIQSFNV